MDTQRQHHKLITAFRVEGGMSQVKPLATPSVLRVADADGKRALHWALEHHYNPKVIKLVISRHLPALGSGQRGLGIVAALPTCWSTAATRSGSTASLSSSSCATPHTL